MMTPKEQLAFELEPKWLEPVVLSESPFFIQLTRLWFAWFAWPQSWTWQLAMVK